MSDRSNQPSCTQGGASLSPQTKLRLFADSAGYCQNPACELPLFSDDLEADLHFAEVAHIIASKDLGPRANSRIPRSIRHGYANLILLCPNCHTIVDKAPGVYTGELLRKWKVAHVERIRRTFGHECDSRAAARAKVKPILDANRRIFDLYGPNREYRFNPEAEEAHVWRRKVIAQVIPNNLMILRIVDANWRFLSEYERETVEAFRQHVDDLSARHLSDCDLIARQFPDDMNEVLKCPY